MTAPKYTQRVKHYSDTDNTRTIRNIVTKPLTSWISDY